MEKRYKLTKEPVDIHPTRPEEQVQAHFQAVRAEWEASQPCQQLKSALRSTSIRYTKVVALGLGSIAFSDMQRPRPAMQHALLLTLRDALEQPTQDSEYSCPSPLSPRSSILCYAQDPVYTEVDKAVLAKHGVTTLDDPKGILEVDDSTAVLSCSPNIPVKQLISDIANPAIMMVDRVDDYDPPDKPMYICPFLFLATCITS